MSTEVLTPVVTQPSVPAITAQQPYKTQAWVASFAVAAMALSMLICTTMAIMVSIEVHDAVTVIKAGMSALGGLAGLGGE